MNRISITLLLLVMIGSPSLLMADQAGRQTLFVIERSKNANIVQYEAQIAADGRLDQAQPVVCYWIRLAEQGQIKKLSWIQRRFAYGFKSRLDEDRLGVTLDMAADLGAPVRVRKVGDTYMAIMEIDGKSSQLKKVFINATGRKPFIKLNYVELYGLDLDNGMETYQRFDS